MSISDTSLEAARVEIEILRGMTGEQRVKLAFKLTDILRRSSLSRIRAEHPEWTDWQVKRELLRIAFHPEPLPPGLP